MINKQVANVLQLWRHRKSSNIKTILVNGQVQVILILRDQVCVITMVLYFLKDSYLQISRGEKFDVAGRIGRRLVGCDYYEDGIMVLFVEI